MQNQLKKIQTLNENLKKEKENIENELEKSIQNERKTEMKLTTTKKLSNIVENEKNIKIEVRKISIFSIINFYLIFVCNA